MHRRTPDVQRSSRKLWRSPGRTDHLIATTDASAPAGTDPPERIDRDLPGAGPPFRVGLARPARSALLADVGPEGLQRCATSRGREPAPGPARPAGSSTTARPTRPATSWSPPGWRRPKTPVEAPGRARPRGGVGQFGNGDGHLFGSSSFRGRSWRRRDRLLNFYRDRDNFGRAATAHRAGACRPEWHERGSSPTESAPLPDEAPVRLSQRLESQVGI
jgi:hypothetical protein